MKEADFAAYSPVECWTVSWTTAYAFRLQSASVPVLDGGIADSIPVEYALSQGYERLVVILTRNKGYRKKKAG